MMQDFSSTIVKVTVMSHLQMITVTLRKEMESASDLRNETKKWSYLYNSHGLSYVLQEDTLILVVCHELHVLKSQNKCHQKSTFY